MHDAYLAFRNCGSASFLCLLIGLLGVGVGFIGVALLVTRARNATWILGAVAAVLGVCALGAGLFGRETGLRKTEEALSGESVDASQKALIRRVGTEEANQCISVGAATGALPFATGALAVAIGLSLRKKKPETA